jgi:carboxylesterase type B
MPSNNSFLQASQTGYNVSEDCLYLNVIRPSNSSKKHRGGLPVAVWIYGGGFSQGSGVDTRYNLSFIVQESVNLGQPMLGITLNYRLSAWGFLQGDQVRGSGDTNIGLRDQRLALQWIQENIASFGGDPEQVTIWGQSAGAGSVGMHIMAYNGRDDKLFRSAIMESGSPVAISDPDRIRT